MGVGAYTLVFNLYMASLGISAAALGTILGLGTLGLALGVLPAGLLADRWGRKRTLILGGLLSGPLSLAQCLSPDPAAIAAAGFVAGLGGAAVAVVALPLLLESVVPASRAAVLATGGALTLLGTAAGSALGGRLPALLAPRLGTAPGGPVAYRATLLLALAVAGTTALPLLVWLRDPHRPQPWRRAPAGLGDRSWRRLALRLALVTGLVGLGAGFIIPYLNLYFVRVVGLSAADFGALSAASQLVLGAATLLAGALVARTGVVAAVAATQLLSVAALLLLAAAPSPQVAGGAYIARQALMDMTAPVAQGWLLGLAAPEQRATTSSLLLVAQQAPWALSSALGGRLQGQAGFLPGFLLTAACYVAASLCWILWFRGEGAPVGQESAELGRIEVR